MKWLTRLLCRHLWGEWIVYSRREQAWTPNLDYPVRYTRCVRLRRCEECGKIEERTT